MSTNTFFFDLFWILLLYKQVRYRIAFWLKKHFCRWTVWKQCKKMTNDAGVKFNPNFACHKCFCLDARFWSRSDGIKRTVFSLFFSLHFVEGSFKIACVSVFSSDGKWTFCLFLDRRVKADKIWQFISIYRDFCGANVARVFVVMMGIYARIGRLVG